MKDNIFQELTNEKINSKIITEFANKDLAKIKLQYSTIESMKPILDFVGTMKENAKLAKISKYYKIQQNLIMFADSINDVKMKESLNIIYTLNINDFENFVNKAKEIIIINANRRLEICQENTEFKQLSEKLNEINEYLKKEGKENIDNELSKLSGYEYFTTLEDFIKRGKKIVTRYRRRVKKIQTDIISEKYASRCSSRKPANMLQEKPYDIKFYTESKTQVTRCKGFYDIDNSKFILDTPASFGGRLTREYHQLYLLFLNIFLQNKFRPDRRFEAYYPNTVNENYVVIDSKDLNDKYLKKSKTNLNQNMKYIESIAKTFYNFRVSFKDDSTNINGALIDVVPFTAPNSKYTLFAVGLTNYSQYEAENLSNNGFPKTAFKLNLNKQYDIVWWLTIHINKIYSTMKAIKVNNKTLLLDTLFENIQGGKELLNEVKGKSTKHKNLYIQRSIISPLTNCLGIYKFDELITNYEIVEDDHYHEDHVLRKKLILHFNFFNKTDKIGDGK